MYVLKLKHHFDAAHRLILDYDSPCQNDHGHRWEIEIEISARELNTNGMIVDFKYLKEIVNELDHKNLNEILPFNPTAENISHYLRTKIQKLNDKAGVVVTVWESPDASITNLEY